MPPGPPWLVPRPGASRAWGLGWHGGGAALSARLVPGWSPAGPRLVLSGREVPERAAAGSGRRAWSQQSVPSAEPRLAAVWVGGAVTSPPGEHRDPGHDGRGLRGPGRLAAPREGPPDAVRGALSTDWEFAGRASSPRRAGPMRPAPRLHLAISERGSFSFGVSPGEVATQGRGGPGPPPARPTGSPLLRHSRQRRLDGRAERWSPGPAAEHPHRGCARPVLRPASGPQRRVQAAGGHPGARGRAWPGSGDPRAWGAPSAGEGCWPGLEGAGWGRRVTGSAHPGLGGA